MASIGARMFLVSLLLGTWSAPQAADLLANGSGWLIERGTDQPSYAAVKPAVANVNVDTVVLACEQTWRSPVLQLQLYLTDDGPLQPTYPLLHPLKADPLAAITIDQRTWPVALLFADDYAVLADTLKGPFPALSEELVSAMQAGAQMTLHFDLLEEWPGQPASFDSEAVVDLVAPGGREAIAAMRRCADPPQPLQAAAPQ
jgi:hypothetical protein